MRSILSVGKYVILSRVTSHLVKSCPMTTTQTPFGYISDSQLLDRIKKLNHDKKHEQVIELFYQCLSRTSKQIPSSIIIEALKACTQLKDVQHGNRIHRAITSYVDENSYVLSALMNFYVTCGDTRSAEELFDKCTNKSIYGFGIMMKGYIKNDQAAKAIDLFHQIQKPDDIILNLVFNACAQLGTQDALLLVKRVSSNLAKDSTSNPLLMTSLVDALMTCGDLNSAVAIFNQCASKSLEMQGAVMKGYIKNKQAAKAIDLFRQIQKPNDVILSLLFNACAQLGTPEALCLGKKVLANLSKSSKANIRLMTSLVDALMKCGDVVTAVHIADKCQSSSLELAGALMKGYIKNDQAAKAIDLFHRIQKPDDIILNLLFNACAQLGTQDALLIIKRVSSNLSKDSTSNPLLMTSLVDALMTCGDMNSALAIFNQCSSKSLEMQGAMMKGYIKNKQASKAIDLFHQIQNPDDIILSLLLNACAQLGTSEALSIVRRVASNRKISTTDNLRLVHSLLDAFIKCHDLRAAETFFKKMLIKNVSSYASLMSGYIKEDEPQKVLELFQGMIKDSVEPSESVLFCVIKALGQIGTVELCESIISHIPKSLHVSLRGQTALVDMWGKVGLISSARQLFQEISHPDTVAYNAMINAYGLNGMGNEALELFHRMPSQLIDEISYVCVLNACSHAGLVDQARHIFRTIQNKTPIIYTTLVDCLSRMALFDEAQQIIEEFEQHQAPTYIMHMALLSGARTHNHIQLAEHVFSDIKILFPEHDQLLTSASVLLANTYGSLGEHDKASIIHKKLHQSGVKKRIGISWTSVYGLISTFRAHDQSHARSREIYNEIKRISQELSAHGHKYDGSWITRSLSDNETVESVLCGHSEKLAIAWNFVVNPNTKRIQVVKNLRVCGDCHRTTKLIAKIRKCEIIVRDANRIHHFNPDGRCSCGDHF